MNFFSFCIQEKEKKWSIGKREQKKKLAENLKSEYTVVD